MNFEAPSRLKPRYTSGNSSYSSNSPSNKSQSNNNDNGDDCDDDNLSFTETVKLLWQKRRRKERAAKYHHLRSQSKTQFVKTLNVAKLALVVILLIVNIHFFPRLYTSLQRHQSNDEQFDELNDEEIEKRYKMAIEAAGETNERRGMPEHIRQEIKAKLKLIKESELHVKRFAMKPSRIREHNLSVKIPEAIDQMYQDITTASLDSDIPVFWHILKSGGTSIKDIFGSCMHMVEATEAGVLNGHINDSKIEKMLLGENGIEYVNVDTTTAEGIKRAIEMKLVESELAELIVTPLLHDSAQLFNNTSNHKGRVFALFRHPVERAVSLYHYLQKATWEPTFSESLKNIKTIEDYAISEFAEDNWMVRFLTNKMTEMVTRDDLAVAKEILRRKILIGLVIDVRSAIERFMNYFGWDYNSLTSEQQQCLNQSFMNGSNRNTHEMIEEDTMGWRILRANSLLDLELYDYALQLYEEQGRMLGVSS
mmetsp:Transcript_15627/g.18160  ORF Transcript_15627/g.18160 Transcript_15627/m.18160 type:complete len:480 (+) Transcript_15627:60-1499(+)